MAWEIQYIYKRNISACMKYGFISKVAATPANISGSCALKHIYPKKRIVFAGKWCCSKKARKTLKKTVVLAK